MLRSETIVTIRNTGLEAQRGTMISKKIRRMLGEFAKLESGQRGFHLTTLAVMLTRFQCTYRWLLGSVDLRHCINYSGFRQQSFKRNASLDNGSQRSQTR